MREEVAVVSVEEKEGSFSRGEGAIVSAEERER